MMLKAARAAAIAALSIAAIVAVFSSSRAQSAGPRADRVFELRVYHAYPGRLPALQSNFRDFNIRFLRKHGISSVGYWTRADSPASEDTLIFILAHDSREAADAHWKEFREDPEWQKLARASEADGKIVERVESTFLTPTDYSPLK